MIWLIKVGIVLIENLKNGQTGTKLLMYVNSGEDGCVQVMSGLMRVMRFLTTKFSRCPTKSLSGWINGFMKHQIKCLMQWIGGITGAGRVVALAQVIGLSSEDRSAAASRSKNYFLVYDRTVLLVSDKESAGPVAHSVPYKNSHAIFFALLVFLSAIFLDRESLIYALTNDEENQIIHYMVQLPEKHFVALQGKLIPVTFKLYDAVDDGTLLWEETQDVRILSTGVFHALLGSVTPFSNASGGMSELFSDNPRWLHILASTGEELVPMQQLMSATGSSTFRPSCPEDMSDLGTFCIDKVPVRSQVSWYASVEACEALGKRLCSNSEWLDACDTAPANGVEQLPPPKHESEWLANWVFETSSKVFSAVDRGYYRCVTESHPWPSDRPYAVKWYRCCK